MNEQPALRVLRGAPTPEELAVLTAVVAAASGGDAAGTGDEPRRGRWNDPAAGHRRPRLGGPGAWRGSSR